MHTIFCILFMIILLGLLIRHLLYQRQIREICRQLEFLQEETTNKRLQLDLSSRDLVLLANQINQILDSQKQKETELLRKEEDLKEALTNISHDIRTPLTSMKGFFELYLREQDPKQQTYYEKIIQDRMDDTQALLEELFTYTKLQNNSYELELTECDFTRIVMNCLFGFYEQWQEIQILPELEISETPATVLCNESAVKRILTNILRNATIHGAGSIQITYQIQNGQVVFHCSNPVDNTEKPDPEQVFDRFYRADAARSQTSNGLGLSIAKELTQRMDGEISAEMNGSIFTIAVRFSLLH